MLRTSLYSFPRINEISFRKRSVQSKYSRTPTLGAKARRLIDTVRTDVASRARRGFPLTHFGSAKEERPISGPGAGDVARAKGLFLATHVTRWPSMWRLRFRRLRSIYLAERSPSSIPLNRELVEGDEWYGCCEENLRHTVSESVAVFPCAALCPELGWPPSPRGGCC